MRQVLFVTLGTRDVSIDKEVLLNHFDAAVIESLYRSGAQREAPVPRKIGEFLSQNYSVIKPAIKTPILSPFFALAKRQKMVFERVVLVATDQAEGIGEWYRSNDSIEFANLLVKHLPQAFDFSVQGKVEVYTIQENVTYLDVMFSFFATAFESKKFTFLEELDHIHVLNQGGIDAINNALMLNALYEYGEKVSLYSVNEKDNVCLPLQFPQQFGTEQEKKRMRQAIQRFDYSMIRNSNLSADLQHLGAYAEARLNFDFEVAEQNLNQLNSNLRSVQIQGLQSLQEAKNSAEGLINEVFWNAKVRLHQEAYVDFVQRFFRIIEHLAKAACLNFLGFEDDHRRWGANLSDFLNKPENTALKDHLDNYRVNGNKLKYDNGNIEVYMAILDFIDPTKFAYLEKIKPLKAMRNDGIGAHGFAPISLRTILETLALQSKSDLFGLMDELQDFLGVDGDGPFVKVNADLMQLI